MTTNTQKGFTLIELAIVLATISLVLAVILGDRARLESSRVSNAYSTVKDFKEAAITFRSRTNELPGVSAISATGNDYSNAYNDTNANRSSIKFFDALRGDGLIESGTNGELMENPFGGVYGVVSDAFGNNDGINICLSNVPASAGQVMDYRYDDGDRDTGAIRAAAGTNTTTAEADAYEGNAHTVCVNTDI